MTAPSAVGLLQQQRGWTAWRCMWPFEELGRQGYRVAYAATGSPESGWLSAQAEVVCVYRAEWRPGDEPKALAWRDLLHSRDTALVFDCDDDVYGPDSLARIRATGDAELNARSDAQLERERQARLFALRLADGVTCSTEPLAAVCRQYTDRPVIVVPNAIDLPRFRAALDGYQRTTAGLTIGWAGGNRPDSDAAATAEAWRRIAARFPGVTFAVAGHPLGVLCAAVPPDRLVVLPWLPLEQYPRNFAALDIGCCPLIDTPFNRAKSPIKALELTAAGAVVVASPTVYGGLIEQAQTGFLARTADEWESALTRLIRLPGLRRDLALRLRRKVEAEHALVDNVQCWPDAWTAIRSDFQAAQRVTLAVPA